MQECLVCEIIQSDKDDTILKQTLGWRAVLMENQGVLGATYITTINHRESPGELTNQEWDELRDVTRSLERAIKKVFQPVYFNFACDMNDAARDGLSTHVHFKLRPRYNRPVIVGKEVFDDSGFGTKDISPHRVNRDVLHTIRNIIVGELNEN